MSEDDACGSVKGEFLAVHTQIGGSCSFIQPTRYNFENQSTKATVYETDMGGTIVTDVNRKGCVLAVTKTRLDNSNNHRWQMIGDMDVDNAKKITGVMTRYEWAGDGQIACQGSYETTMTRVESRAAAETQ